MEILRRISALLIALSLALPERSCVNDGQVEIHYPLSSADSVLAVVVVGAVYTLPLLVLLVPRLRLAGLLVGIAATGVGLDYVSYGSTIVADTLLIGWYTYTIGAVVYLGVSLYLLVRLLMPPASPPSQPP